MAQSINPSKGHFQAHMQSVHAIPDHHVKWKCISDCNAIGAYTLVQSRISTKMHPQTPTQMVSIIWLSPGVQRELIKEGSANGAYNPVQSEIQ
jgi:hypothetical protein